MMERVERMEKVGSMERVCLCTAADGKEHSNRGLFHSESPKDRLTPLK